MEFNELLEIVGEEPVFDSSLLLAGDVDPQDVRLQLSRWTKSSRLIQIRRGLYALAPPFQKVQPHPFLIANRLHSASYVSCQSALSYYGLIPDIPQRTISITTRRPTRYDTPLGKFVFRHIKMAYFFGYQQVDLGSNQEAYLATPEKALLDLIYLEPGGDSPPFIQELRLQNVSQLRANRLQKYMRTFDKPKLERAVNQLLTLFGKEMSEENRN